MKEQLFRLIPEFGEIRNCDLRERVLETWVQALSRSNFRTDDLERIPFTMGGAGDLPSLLAHTRGVSKVALRVFETVEEVYGNRLALDRDVLMAGALLHDVGKVLLHSKEGDTSKRSPEALVVWHADNANADLFS
jgi:HD superfamily phosphodiesterase